MTQQQQTHQAQQTVSNPSDDTTPRPGGGGLLEQAQGYANAARRARENCKNGEDAEQELLRRRNQSGQ
jgi:hypothetical protein